MFRKIDQVPEIPLKKLAVFLEEWILMDKDPGLKWVVLLAMKVVKPIYKIIMEDHKQEVEEVDLLLQD